MVSTQNTKEKKKHIVLEYTFCNNDGKIHKSDIQFLECSLVEIVQQEKKYKS